MCWPLTYDLEMPHPDIISNTFGTAKFRLVSALIFHRANGNGALVYNCAWHCLVKTNSCMVIISEIFKAQARHLTYNLDIQWTLAIDNHSEVSRSDTEHHQSCRQDEIPRLNGRTQVRKDRRKWYGCFCRQGNTFEYCKSYHQSKS